PAATPAIYRLSLHDALRSRQDPASPHPREGPALSAAVPLDANHNPNGAYLNENRLNIAGGFERTVVDGALWGTNASYTYSGQRIDRKSTRLNSSHRTISYA